MFSSMICLALAAAMATSANVSVWQSDYVQARDLAARTGKPMAVVIGDGSNGWKKVLPLNETTTSAINSGFVCVYIDKTTTTGKELANAFAMADTIGLVMSDKAGQNQAFRHAGAMKESDVTTAVARYSDTTHVARKTESNEQNPPTYSPPAYSPTQWLQPAASS